MTNNVKISIKVISFFLVFFVFFLYASKVISPKRAGEAGQTARIKTFYSLPEDSLDVIFIGASTFLFGISPLTIWEQNGFTSYVLGSHAQGPIVTYYYLVESVKYQQPKVAIIDANTFIRNIDVDKNEASLRQAIDPLKFSETKYELVREVVGLSEKQSFSSYLFPILRYHSRWEELKTEDFQYYQQNIYAPLKGNIPQFQSKGGEFPEDFMSQTSNLEEQITNSRYYFEQIVDFCKKNNIDLILLTQPRADWTYSKYLSLKEFAENHDIEYLDYNIPEKMDRIGLNFSADLKDDKHLNANGTIKISKDIGEFLQNNYQFTDKRQDPAFAQWNLDLEYFKDLISKKLE